MTIALDGTLFSISTLVNVILLMVVLEALCLLVLSKTWSGAPRFSRVVGNLVSGAFLVAAIRLTIDGAQPALILLCLTGSLLGHLFDLSQQFRR